MVMYLSSRVQKTLGSRLMATASLFAALTGFSFTMLSGCLTADSDLTHSPNDSTIKPIPDSWSRTSMPIEFLGDYQYRHVDYTEQGQALVFETGYRLRITEVGGYFGWRFNVDSTGLLLRRVDDGPVEQRGIHIAGTWRGDSLYPDSSRLWLPDDVSSPREPWVVYGRTLSVHARDTVLYLPGSPSSKAWYQDPVTGRVRVNARVIREVAGETTTYYALVAGIGLLAYERRVGGNLASTGALQIAFSLKYPQTLWP